MAVTSLGRNCDSKSQRASCVFFRGGGILRVLRPSKALNQGKQTDIFTTTVKMIPICSLTQVSGFWAFLGPNRYSKSAPQAKHLKHAGFQLSKKEKPGNLKTALARRNKKENTPKHSFPSFGVLRGASYRSISVLKYATHPLTPLRRSQSKFSGLLKRWFWETVVLAPAENKGRFDKNGENDEFEFYPRKQGLWSSEPRK